MSPLIDKSAMGVEVSWSFGNGDAEAVDLPRADVLDIFSDHGFDVTNELAMTVDGAIRRAARYVRQDRHLVVRELAKPNKTTPRAYGVYKRIAREGESGDDWECHARVKVEGQSVVCLPPEQYSHQLDLEVVKIGEGMATMARKCLDRVMNVDISQALTAAGSAGGWISRRRNAGGVYFIVRSKQAEAFVGVLQALAAETDRLPRWRRFAPQIQEVYPKPLTMASWTESALDAFAADVASLKTQLGQMFTDGTMRDRTIEARAAECDALVAKAERYQLLLAGALPSITESLKQIKEAFTSALVSGIESASREFEAFEDIDAEFELIEAGGKPSSGRSEISWEDL